MGFFTSQTFWTVVAGLSLALLARELFGRPVIKRSGKPLRKPSDTLPLVGNGIRFLQARHKLFAWFVKCERQFGYETLAVSVPTLPPGIIISDPRNLDFVFKNERIFGKGEFVKRRSWDLFGNGIINADGELWKAQRKAGLSFLNGANLRVLTDIALPRILTQSVSFLQSQADGRVLDLQALFHEITTQLMGKMAYDMEMHANDEFTGAFEYASGATAKRFQNPFWYLTELAFGFRLRKSLAVVRSYGHFIVASAIKKREDGKQTVRSENEGSAKLDSISGSLIQSLFDAIGQETVVAEAALNYLSAGRDTTAQALTWTFYLLMSHRYVAGRIRKEVQQVLCGLERDSESKSIDSTTFTTVSMPYTMAVFYETLRLFPPVPFEFKQVVESAALLPDGTHLPKGAVVLWCTWAMNRSKVTWGEDADDFRPERWLVDGKLVSKSASEFPVFNGGPRTCLGKTMAEVVAVQVIATIAWMFDFVPAFEGKRVSKTSLTLPMEGGLPCFVKKRSVALST